MWKTLTAQEILKLTYATDVVTPMQHTKPSPRRVAPIDTIIREAQKGGITQSQETERMGLEEEIQQGNLRL